MKTAIGHFFARRWKLDQAFLQARAAPRHAACASERATPGLFADGPCASLSWAQRAGVQFAQHIACTYRGPCAAGRVTDSRGFRLDATCRAAWSGRAR